MRQMTVEQDLVERARRFAAEVAPRGAEIEAARRIPRDISVALGEAGFYRMFVTAPLGGLEVSPRTAAEVYEAAVRGETSRPPSGAVTNIR
jgi:alkylation response protein AidB-like acyl-CoA dehydrogenase